MSKSVLPFPFKFYKVNKKDYSLRNTHRKKVKHRRCSVKRQAGNKCNLNDLILRRTQLQILTSEAGTAARLGRKMSYQI